MVSSRSARYRVLPAATQVVPYILAAQVGKETKGIFEGSTDIGKTQKGSTVYDPATAAYRVTGGGKDSGAMRTPSISPGSACPATPP